MSHRPEHFSGQTISTLPEVIVKFEAARRRPSPRLGLRIPVTPVQNHAPVSQELSDNSVENVEQPSEAEQLTQAFIAEAAVAEHVKPGQAQVLRDDKRGLFSIIEGFSDNQDPDKVEADAAVAVAAFGEGISQYWEQDTDSFTPENAVDGMKQALRSGYEALAQAAAEGEGSTEMGVVGTFARIFKNPNGTYGAVIGHVGDGAALLQPETGELSKYLTEREITEDGDFSNSFSADPEDGMAELDQFTFIPELQDGARIALLSGVVVDGKDNGLVHPWKLQRVLANKDKLAAASELVKFGPDTEDQLAVLIDVKAVTEQVAPAVAPDVAADDIAASDEAAKAVPDPNVAQYNKTQTSDRLAKRAVRHLTQLPKHLGAKLSIAALNVMARDKNDQTAAAGQEKSKRKYIIAGAAGGLALAAATYVQLRYGIVGGHDAAQSAAKGSQRLTEINNHAQDAIQEVGKRTTQALQAQQTAEHAKDLGQHGANLLHHGVHHSADATVAHDALHHAAKAHTAILHHNHVIWNDTQHVIQTHYPHLSPHEIQEHTKRAVDGILHANHINYTDARHLPDDYTYKVPRHIWHVMTNFKD